MSFGCRILGLAALLFTALTAAPARAAEIFPSVSPTVLRGDGPWDITYQVEVDAGPVDERLVISVGGSQAYPGALTLTGAGKLTDGPTQIMSAIRSSCGLVATTENGPSFGGGGDSLLELPAGGSALLTMTTRIDARFPLGVDTIKPIAIAVGDAPAGFDLFKSWQTPLNWREVAFEPLRIVARRFVPLTVRLKPPGGTGPSPPGERVLITGRTSPMLAGQPIDLRARFIPEGSPPDYRSTAQYPIALGRAIVSPDGMFRFATWRPQTPGRYVVGAFYRSHNPRWHDAALTGCGPSITVGQDGPGNV